MASDNRGQGRGRNRRRAGRNNNPEGHNQYSGLIGTARSNPFLAAAAAGGLVAAGVFLWTRRSQISDQIDDLSDQISEWREGIGASTSSSTNHSDGRTQPEIAREALALKEGGASS